MAYYNNAIYTAPNTNIIIATNITNTNCAATTKTVTTTTKISSLSDFTARLQLTYGEINQ